MFPLSQFALPLAFVADWLTLSWLAAAAAPVLIHLWNRRKYREETWAAIEFLLAAIKKNSRRIQIEQLILLAVRTLLIILLVVALARPMTEALGMASSLSSPRTLHVLVVDGSFSMAYKPTDKTRFERAKQIAAEIVDGARQGDGFVLVLMGAPPRVVVGTPAFEPGDFVEEIENLKLPHGGASLPATVTVLEEIIERATKEDSRLARSQIYFLTDLGRNTWSPELGGTAAAADFRQRTSALAQRSGIAVVDLGQVGAENLAVTDARVREPFVTISQLVTVEADLHNFGRQDRTAQTVEMYVDGQRVQEKQVDVRAGDSAAVGFTHRFQSPGDHEIEVRLAGDLLDVDNHRWIAVSVKEHLRALCVGSKQPGAADYLTLALEPDYKHTDRPVVRPESVTESALWELDLKQYDCVFLCNVGRFSPSEARILEAYARNGGGLVFFLGDRVVPDSYNSAMLDDSHGGAHVLPARVVDFAPAALERGYHFDPLGYDAPLTRIFRDKPEGLAATPLYRYVKLEVPEGSTAKVLLGIKPTGDPAIVEESIGEGQSLVAAFPASTASRIADGAARYLWTPMPMLGSFLPVVQELLAAAVRGQMGLHNVLVGEALGGRLEPVTDGVPLIVHTPEAGHETVRPQADGEYHRWSFDATDTSGVYTAEFGPPLQVQQRFAVNVDTSESDLARADDADVRTLSDDIEIWTKWQDLDTETEVKLRDESDAHKWFLLAVLGLLFTETALAWWLGNRSA